MLAKICSYSNFGPLSPNLTWVFTYGNRIANFRVVRYRKIGRFLVFDTHHHQISFFSEFGPQYYFVIIIIIGSGEYLKMKCFPIHSDSECRVIFIINTNNSTFKPHTATSCSSYHLLMRLKH